MDIVLPVLLLVLMYFLKAITYRVITLLQAVDIIFELPSDTMFLGLSYLTATTIKNRQLDYLVIILIIGIILEIISIFLWRIGLQFKAKGKGNIQISYLICIINYIICIVAFLYSINYISIKE